MPRRLRGPAEGTAPALSTRSALPPGSGESRRGCCPWRKEMPMKWVYLLIAIVAEVVGTSALKASLSAML